MYMSSMTKSRKIALFSVLFIVLAGAGALYYIYYGAKNIVKDAVGKIDTKGGDFLNETDTLTKEEKILAQLDSIAMENKKIEKKMTGSRISVLITGVDSRIGYKGKRADANHLVNIYLDSAFVEIISIPRATQTTKPHYLANLRAIEGEASYMNEVCKIAGVDKIDYHIEFGLSQAIRLLELLGFKNNAVQVLRTLRSRKVYGAGDYQRSYNQGQFIRQMVLKLFPHLDDFRMEVTIRAGLMLVDTDIDIGTINKIVKEMKAKGFPKSDKDVIVNLKPPVRHNLRTINFRNDKALDSAYRFVARRSKNPIVAEDTIKDSKVYSNAMVSKRAYNKLNFKIKKSKELLESNPKAAIAKLKVPVYQRAWHQISNKKKRVSIREQMCSLLVQAYQKTGKTEEAAEIQRILDSEIQSEKLLEEIESAKSGKDTLKDKDSVKTK